MRLWASARCEELQWSRRRDEEGLWGLWATSRRRWNGFTSCADVDRRLWEGLFDAPSQVGCYSMQSRFFFFFFFFFFFHSAWWPLHLYFSIQISVEHGPEWQKYNYSFTRIEGVRAGFKRSPKPHFIGSTKSGEKKPRWGSKLSYESHY